MEILIEIFFWVVAAYIVFWSGYELFFAFASRFWKENFQIKNDNVLTFQILIPAFREGQALLDTIRAALNGKYPKDSFEVVVLGQDLEQSIIEEIEKLQVRIVKTGALGSKFNALKNFFANETKLADAVLVLDADNILSENALIVANEYLLRGRDCVQLERRKTPGKTALGILDRWNTAIGVQLANPARMSLNINVLLFGSGFAVRSEVYREFVRTWPNSIVEDKFFDLFLASKKLNLIYSVEAGVIDSTTQKSDAFSSQRSRWVGGRLEAKNYARKLWLKDPFNLELLDKYVHYALPQRSVFLPLSTLAFIGFLFSTIPGISTIGIVGILIKPLTLILATPSELWGRELLKAFAAIPISTVSIIKARIYSKRTQGDDFKVTPK